MYEFWCDYIKPKYGKKLDRPFLKGKNKNVIILMKNDLGGKILKEFTTLRPKTYKYLIWRQ